MNAAQTGSAPATTYTYDPFGSMSTNGAATNWPLQYQGLEHEFIDPSIPVYVTGGGQFYDAQIMRSLSETSQTSSGGAGGGGGGGGGGFSPPGMAIPPPSGSGGGLSWQSLRNDSQQASQVGSDVFNVANGLGLAFGSPGEMTPLALPLAAIAAAVDFMVNFFEDLFGGSDNPPTPRQLLHGRHPLYPVILGIPPSLIPTEESEGKCKFCGDPSPCPNARPLQKKSSAPSPAPTPAPPPSCGEALGELGVGMLGTALTLGPIIAAPYLAPELFGGLEGAASFGKMGIVAVPGLTLMEQGFVGVRQSCF